MRPREIDEVPRRRDSARLRRQILASYVTIAATGALIAAIAVFAARSVVRDQNDLVTRGSLLALNASKLSADFERMSANTRGYLRLRKPLLLDRLHAAHADLRRVADEMLHTPEPETAAIVEDVSLSAEEYIEIVEEFAATAVTLGPAEMRDRFGNRLEPLRDRLSSELGALREIAQERFDLAERSAAARSTFSLHFLAIAIALMTSLALALLFVLVRALRALEHNEALVAKANDDLEAFAGRIAHDVKNALAPLLLATHDLRRRAGDDDTRHVADLFTRRLNTMVRVVDSLLAFSRAGESLGGRASVEAAIDEVLTDHAELIARCGVAVSKRVEPAELACAPGLLYMVLTNLVGNAIKFIQGRDTRRVHIATSCDGALYEIAIEDTGPGIPQEDLRHIFEPFYRADPDAAPGAGIGLATVQRIVTAHGGRVAVSSTVGVGACFRVHLPLAAAGASTRRASPRDLQVQ